MSQDSIDAWGFTWYPGGQKEVLYNVHPLLSLQLQAVDTCVSADGAQYITETAYWKQADIPIDP